MEKKCNGLHCRCMNRNCPDVHYADCVEHNESLRLGLVVTAPEYEEQPLESSATKDVALRIPGEYFVEHTPRGSRLEIGKTTFWVALEQITQDRFDGIFFTVTRSFAKQKGLEKFIYTPSLPKVTLSKIVLGEAITQAEIEELYDWFELKSFNEFIGEIQAIVGSIRLTENRKTGLYRK